MSWQVLITDAAIKNAGAQAVELLREAGCQLVFAPRFGPLSAEQLEPLLPGMDAVIASLDQFTAAVLSSPAAATLKIISRWGVGYDAVDVAAATQRGIVVTNTPGLLNEAVADYAFALLLTLARRVHEGHLAMRAGEWRASWGCDVAGKTLGLVGCGRIGQAVARRAAGFHLRLLGCDCAPGETARQLGVQFVSLAELLRESDFVSLHAALTPASRGLIGEAQFRQMKPTALFVNTGRGALVDEAALVRALREGWIAGAAVDVYAVEPLPADHPLRSAPNILLSPHQASFGRETGERVSLVAVQAIVDLLRGRRPQHVVNPDVWQSPALRVPLPA